VLLGLGYGVDSIIAISEVGVVMQKLLWSSYKSSVRSHCLKYGVPHDMMQGVWVLIMCFEWKRRVLPIKLVYESRVGRYGIMPCNMSGVVIKRVYVEGRLECLR
jgi:hypothetical protein